MATETHTQARVTIQATLEILSSHGMTIRLRRHGVQALSRLVPYASGLRGANVSATLRNLVWGVVGCLEAALSQDAIADCETMLQDAKDGLCEALALLEAA